MHKNKHDDEIVIDLNSFMEFKPSSHFELVSDNQLDSVSGSGIKTGKMKPPGGDPGLPSIL
jgi:hypothetical protein